MNLSDSISWADPGSITQSHRLGVCIQINVDGERSAVDDVHPRLVSVETPVVGRSLAAVHGKRRQAGETLLIIHPKTGVATCHRAAKKASLLLLLLLLSSSSSTSLLLLLFYFPRRCDALAGRQTARRRRRESGRGRQGEHRRSEQKKTTKNQRVPLGAVDQREKKWRQRPSTVKVLRSTARVCVCVCVRLSVVLKVKLFVNAALPIKRRPTSADRYPLDDPKSTREIPALSSHRKRNRIHRHRHGVLPRDGIPGIESFVSFQSRSMMLFFFFSS